MTDHEHASAGHKLGQLVGDWFEEFFVLPLLQAAADQLRRYLDHRFRARKVRQGDRILWRDVEGNAVDYDFVMELDGAEESLDTYVDRVRAALGALPQEIRIIAQRHSKPQVFERIAEATNFLQKPKFDFTQSTESSVYEITYTDGTEFDRSLDTLDEVRDIHRQIERLAAHVASLKGVKG